MLRVHMELRTAAVVPMRKAAAGAELGHAEGHAAGREGPEHLRLKQQVHEMPELIGLSSEAEGQMERVFETGNRADLTFSDGKLEVAVEVEVEGENATLIGAMQAVKYRVLLAMENGFALDSRRTRAVLVAHDIPPATLRFCEQYDVEAWTVSRDGKRGARVSARAPRRRARA